MKTIHFHGYLKEKLGEKYTFDVDSPAMAMCALRSQIKGFSEAVKDGEFHIIMDSGHHKYSLGEDELSFRLGKARDLHIVPVVRGAGGKKSGVLKIVLGVALLAVGVGFGLTAVGGFGAAAFGITSHITYGGIAMFGLALTLAGVSQLLTPKLQTPSYEQQGPADDRPSFLFNGATNQSVQGVPVPVIFGKFRVGSIPVSRGLATEKI